MGVEVAARAGAKTVLWVEIYMLLPMTKMVVAMLIFHQKPCIR